MEDITIGDRCQFANNLVIVDHDHDYRRLGPLPDSAGAYRQ